MEEQKMVDAFKVLHKNMPRAPEPLVESMVRTVRALEAKRAADKAPVAPQRVHKRAMERKPSSKTIKPPGM